MNDNLLTWHVAIWFVLVFQEANTMNIRVLVVRELDDAVERENIQL